MVRSQYDRSSSQVKRRNDVLNSIRIRSIFRRIASNEFDKQLNVHVAMDNTLILDDIRKMRIEMKKYKTKFFSSQFEGKLSQNTMTVETIQRKPNENAKKSWKPLVIIIPLRLGLNDVNVEYIDQLKVKLRRFSSFKKCFVFFVFSSAFNYLKRWVSSVENRITLIISLVMLKMMNYCIWILTLHKCTSTQQWRKTTRLFIVIESIEWNFPLWIRRWRS